MDKNELLELLQDKARELASLEKWLQANNQQRLAEFVSVKRLVNFKAQEILSSTPKENADKAFCDFYAELFAGVDHARENQLHTLHELYGVAIDYLRDLHVMLADYLL